MASNFDTLIFYYPRHRDAALAYQEQHGGAVRSLKGWNGRVEERADVVVVDNDAPDDVATLYAEDGSEVVYLFGGEPDEPEPDPDPEPDEDEPEPEEDEDGDGLPDGYHLEQSGTWYKVIGPDGEQVGNAKRSPEDAIAQVVGD